MHGLYMFPSYLHPRLTCGFKKTRLNQSFRNPQTPVIVLILKRPLHIKCSYCIGRGSRASCALHCRGANEQSRSLIFIILPYTCSWLILLRLAGPVIYGAISNADYSTNISEYIILVAAARLERPVISSDGKFAYGGRGVPTRATYK